MGYDAFQEYERVEGKGKWYRVYVGTFHNEQEARKIASELKEKESFPILSL